MSFLVTLADENSQFSCEASQSILDAALNHGIMLSYGCRNGLCGSCQGSIISGQIEYPQGQPDGISDDDVKSGEALFCKAVPKSDVTIKVKVMLPQHEIEVKTLPAKVKEINHLSEDVIQLILKLPEVEPLHFKAGQWVYFVMKDGRKRAFSIANAPNDRNELELQIRHAVGGVFTDFVFNDLILGSLLRIEGPHGSFFYQKDDRPILLVAGGTGFAPIQGIFQEMSAQGLTQPVHLFWGSRAKRDLYQESLIQKWVDQYGISYTPVLSDPVAEDNWSEKTGFVHEAVLQEFQDLSPYAVYMAGPPQMIESCKQTFTAAGLDEARLYYDSFEYSTDALDAMKGKNNEGQ